MIQDLCKGQAVTYEETLLDPDMDFYILGLAPNAARLSVRFFLHNHFSSILQNVQAHYDRLEIVKPSFEKFETLPVWKLLSETVNQNSREKEPGPGVSRANPEGNPQQYPLSGYPFERRDHPYSGRKENHLGTRRHSQGILFAEYPSRCTKGGFNGVPESRKQKPILHPGTAFFRAGRGAVRRQSRDQRHHQRPVFQFGFRNAVDCIPYPAESIGETPEKTHRRPADLL